MIPNDQLLDGITEDGSPLPPSNDHLLGTDLLGRDLLSRVLYGARTSIFIGLVANGISITIGAALGLVAGYARGLVGGTIMRFTDLMMAFPALLLAIALSAIFEPSLWIVAMVIAMVNWVQIARVIYTETTALAERDFVLAARGLGARPSGRCPDPPHPAASSANHPRLDHARHRRDRAARGDPVLSRYRRPPADTIVGQHHL